MNLEQIHSLFNSAMSVEQAREKWSKKRRMTAEEMFGVTTSSDTHKQWSSEKVLKLGSSIKALKIDITLSIGLIISSNL